MGKVGFSFGKKKKVLNKPYSSNNVDKKPDFETVHRENNGPLKVPLKAVEGSALRDVDSKPALIIPVARRTPADTKRTAGSRSAPYSASSSQPLDEKKFGLIVKGDPGGLRVKSVGDSPLLQRNRKDFEEDMETRPDHLSTSNYEKIPVDAFGEALLRGMGADLSAEQSKEAQEQKIRPKNLGLGAPIDPFIEGLNIGKKK